MKQHTMDRFVVPTSVRSMVMLAKNEKGDVCTPQDAVTENGNDQFTCFGCGEKLVVRRAHFRSRVSNNANTTTFAVREHFLHVGDAHTCTTNETWLHGVAKHQLANQPRYPLLLHCAVCGQKQPFRVDHAADEEVRGITEYRLDNRRVVDVALLCAERCVGVIEVCHSHPCDDAKLLDLMDIVSDAWCEVRASDVIHCMKNGEPIPVRVCSISRCEGCREKPQAKINDILGRTIAERSKVEELKKATEELERTIEEHVQTEAALATQRKRKRLLDVGGETILKFGKWKGLALEALLQEDLGYVLWLARGKFELECIDPDAVRIARELVRGLCRICGEKIEGPKWKTLCVECFRETRT